VGEHDWVIVPAVTHIDEDSLAALVARADHPQRGRRMLIAAPTAADAASTLSRDRWGGAWGDGARGATARLPRLILDELAPGGAKAGGGGAGGAGGGGGGGGGPAPLLRRLEEILFAADGAEASRHQQPPQQQQRPRPQPQPQQPPPPPLRLVRCVDAATRETADGVYCRAARQPGTAGALVVFVANLRARGAQVQLRLQDGGEDGGEEDLLRRRTVHDLLRRRPLQHLGADGVLALEPADAVLLEIDV